MKTKQIIYSIGILIVLAAIAFFASRALRTDAAHGGAPAVFQLPHESVGGSSQIYTDPVLHFSFSYPAGFIESDSGDASGRLILVSDPVKKDEFQLYVTPFGDAPETVTAIRLHHDIPSLDVREPQTVTVPGGGQGLSFLSAESGVEGDVREIWYAEGGHLYQWSAPVESQSALESAVDSFASDAHSYE